MTAENLLTLAMMGAVVVVFALLHVALRRVPYDDTAPRESWKWPVWSWFPLVLGLGILVGLASNLYWNLRTPETMHDIQPVKGEEAVPSPSPVR